MTAPSPIIPQMQAVSPLTPTLSTPKGHPGEKVDEKVRVKIPALPKKEEGNVPEPGNAEEYFRRGVQLSKKKDIPEAIKAFEKALELNPKLAEAANNLGNLYFEQNLIEKAIEAFKKALAADPKYARAHNNLGIVYTKKGLLDLAVGEYQASLGVNPNYAAPLYNLAWLYARRGEPAKSLDYLKRAFQLDPGLKETATKDPDFSALRGSEEFRKLVGP